MTNLQIEFQLSIQSANFHGKRLSRLFSPEGRHFLLHHKYFRLEGTVKRSIINFYRTNTSTTDNTRQKHF